MPLLQEYSTNRVLVRFKPNTLSVQTVDRLGVRLRKSVGNGATRVYTITDGTPVQQKVAQLSRVPGELPAPLAGIGASSCEEELIRFKAQSGVCAGPATAPESV